MKTVYTEETEEQDADVQFLSSHGEQADTFYDTRHESIRDIQRCNDVVEVNELEFGGLENEWKYYLVQHEDGDMEYDSIYREKK